MSLTNRARILYDSPLSQPRKAIPIVLFLAVLVIISAIVLIRDFFGGMTPAGFQIFLLSLAGTLLISIIPLAILWFLDRREPESKWLYLIAILWGALIATALAYPINTWIFENIGNLVKTTPILQTIYGSDAKTVIGAPLAGPIVEETTKGLGILLLFWLLKSEFDGVRDGFIYGALVGIGFNLLEAPFYVAKGFIATGDVPLYFQMADRFALFGLAGHALYSGLFGMGLGLARQTTRQWLRYAAPVTGWLLGFVGHFLNNAIGLILFLAIYLVTGKSIATQESAKPAVSAVVEPFLNQWFQHSAIRAIAFFPFFLIVGVMLWQSGNWELQVIRDGLADEQEPVITKEEYEGVKGDRQFATRRIPELDRRTSNAIVRAQNELAIRKWRVNHDGKDVETDPLVASWREELARLRDRVKTAVIS